MPEWRGKQTILYAVITSVMHRRGDVIQSPQTLGSGRQYLTSLWRKYV